MTAVNKKFMTANHEKFQRRHISRWNLFFDNDHTKWLLKVLSSASLQNTGRWFCIKTGVYRQRYIRKICQDPRVHNINSSPKKEDIRHIRVAYKSVIVGLQQFILWAIRIKYNKSRMTLKQPPKLDFQSNNYNNNKKCWYKITKIQNQLP